ncbi:hypothetical protein C8F04DRAFT_1199694 [Mycena alexandri]|uniref:Uncharacterized protein n=1 Tax=Mycena alexandri TaxID=1745969 RepID=A0AAD6RZL0_9AGAR|nr:hypothetical protein C8F04DRAFT_1199694 [Mycena alexandri]
MWGGHYEGHKVLDTGQVGGRVVVVEFIGVFMDNPGQRITQIVLELLIPVRQHPPHRHPVKASRNNDSTRNWSNEIFCGQYSTGNVGKRKRMLSGQKNAEKDKMCREATVSFFTSKRLPKDFWPKRTMAVLKESKYWSQPVSTYHAPYIQNHLNLGATESGSVDSQQERHRQLIFFFKVELSAVPRSSSSITVNSITILGVNSPNAMSGGEYPLAQFVVLAR